MFSANSMKIALDITAVVDPYPKLFRLLGRVVIGCHINVRTIGIDGTIFT